MTGEPDYFTVQLAAINLWNEVQDLSSPNSFQSFQNAIVPGVDALHRCMRAIFDVTLKSEASILIVGAGGGREIETLGASPEHYRLTGVDPSPEMLSHAQNSVEEFDLARRTSLVHGVLFVMHFLSGDGAKQSYLKALRQRLRVGSPYLHVDVCFDSPDTFERLRPVYVAHAELNGLGKGQASELAQRVGTMLVLSYEALEQQFADGGLKIVTPFFRGLWYAGWWLEAM